MKFPENAFLENCGGIASRPWNRLVREKQRRITFEIQALSSRFFLLSCCLHTKPVGRANRLRRFTLCHFLEQFRQLLQASDGHMAELSFVQIVHRLVELLQEIQTFRGDARFDDAAIVFLALTRDPGVFFHTVEQAGHIGIAGNHALGDAATENAVGLCSAENAQNVVLRAGEATGLQEVLDLLGQGVGDLEERNEDLVFEKSGFAGRRHRLSLVVITTIVKRKISAPECPWRWLRRRIGRDCSSCRNEEPVRQRVAVAHGLATGRSCTSLIKLCGPSSTIMLTACATSSGVSTFEGSFRVLPENSVATLPGQTRVTRIPKPRRASAIHPARP